jgi:Transposase IS66 family
LALPKADIGLNSTILICYLWVALCLPFTRIRDYLKAFFGKDISTSGLSRHVIRVSRIMEDVYKEILGEIFLGLLVVDGWGAYLALICEQQSCMAHLLRKIRKFRDAFPHLSSIVKFYVKLRRILRDGERL